MKLTKSRLKRIIKEEINKVLEADEMVYAGGTQEPTYDDLAAAGDSIGKYLGMMLNPQPSTIRTPTGEAADVRELLKSLWDTMRASPGDAAGAKAAAVELGFSAASANHITQIAGEVNSMSPTGDMMMNAVEAKGPVTPDARSGPRGSF